ncbi:HET-domain-containing protein [Apiospora arundinis]|uniref:HET-domain-containing protein n=1 Tax=Apiospora arundinis TaxID=335852 RepID=A0ABR2JI70_9PEZI
MSSYQEENNMQLMPWNSVGVAQSLHTGGVPNFDIAQNKERGFLHPPIDSRRQIRVLKILLQATGDSLDCEFDVVDFNGTSATSYFALSYTWGGATGADEVRDIHIIDGTTKQRVPFCVRRNVWDFLASSVVRKDLGGRPVYIDAICINQLDNDEKGHQIQLMQSVYSQALKVIIWLGSSMVNAEMSSNLRSLQEHGDWVWTEKKDKIAGAGTAIGVNGANPVDKQKIAVEFISSHPYWNRTWIIQEIMLASDITIIVGSYTFPWPQVAKLGPQSIQSSFWHHDSHGLPMMNMKLVEGQMRFARRSALLGLIERKTRWDSHVASIPDEGEKHIYLVPCYLAFGTFADHACSDPRDKLYAMLGMVEEDIRKDIVPDYRLGVPQVYRIALAAGFRSVMANLRESLKMRLEAFGILAAHLHEAFGLLERDICGPRTAVLAEPYIHSDVQSDLAEARLLDDDTGLRYRHAQACQSSHTPNSCEPHCLLTGLIQPHGNSSKSIEPKGELAKLEDPVSNHSLAIHIRGSMDASGPLNYQAFEYGQWSGRSSLHSIQNLGSRPEAPIGTSESTKYSQCIFYTDREKGDGDMYWMVKSPHGDYTATMQICRKTDGSDGWTVSYEDAIPKPHHSTCDQCEKPIFAKRYRCLQCLEFDLCSPCMEKAKQTKDEHVDQHDFEAIYHPASSLSHTTNPVKYLALNFRRVPYRMHPGIFNEYRHDPDPSSAVQNCLACGMMFPWSPREGVWPPYWVANLDIMTWLPADEGVPHIRCMGLRLRESDPTDRPPSRLPAGYRFFGQIQLCAIRQQLAFWASSFSPPVELSSDVSLIELVDRRLKERETQGNAIASGSQIVLFLAFPPLPRTARVESGDIVDEDGAWGLRLPQRCVPGEDQNEVPTAPVMCFWTADDFDESTVAKMRNNGGRELKLLPLKADAPAAERQWITFKW